MINAIVQNKEGKTAVIDLSGHSHEMYESLRSIGCSISPEYLRLRDEENEEYRMKLYSDSEIGSKTILVLSERDSLYDAYMLDLAVTNARDEIKDELEENLLHGQYLNVEEVLDDINEMKMQAADTRLSFYCPLTASLDDRDGGYYSVSHDVILGNRDGIDEKLKEEQMPDLGDMAEYLGDHSGLGNKILYAVWNVEEIDEELYGKIDCNLTEPLSPEETEKLRGAVRGQNSDGFGESFEQRAVETDNGDLYVSFWNPSNGYFLDTETEMEQRMGGSMQMGGM